MDYNSIFMRIKTFGCTLKILTSPQKLKRCNLNLYASLLHLKRHLHLFYNWKDLVWQFIHLYHDWRDVLWQRTVLFISLETRIHYLAVVFVFVKIQKLLIYGLEYKKRIAISFSIKTFKILKVTRILVQFHFDSFSKSWSKRHTILTNFLKLIGSF